MQTIYTLVMLLMLVIVCLIQVKSAIANLDNISSKSSPEEEQLAVIGLLGRIIPDSQHKIEITVNRSITFGSKEIFQILSDGETLKVKGTNGVAVSLGINYYLKYFCKAQISWNGVQVNLPDLWPLANVTRSLNDRLRYYLNVCTHSYSMVWWDWTKWENHIDWMALNGINIFLALTGQEYVISKTYKKFGLTDDDMNEYFTGPAFLAWNRMGNIRYWGGPLLNNWIDNQYQLQLKILKRTRQFGMIAALPGFNGHVPVTFSHLFPNATIYKLQKWGHFKNNLTRTYFIDPTDPLYGKISAEYMAMLKEEFGSDHVYSVDPFNEMSPISGSNVYLKNVSRSIYDSLHKSDTQAIWLTQGWMFFNNKTFWTIDRVKSYLTSVPKGGMLVLDLTADVYPQYNRFESFFGQPFIWCMLNNYGGVQGLFGNLNIINDGTFTARNFPNSSMVGTGMAPEGIGNNYIVYDLMTEMAFRKTATNLTEWMIEYTNRRYGLKQKDIRQAWNLLLRSVYNSSSGLRNHGKYIMVRRPNLHKKAIIWYEISDVFMSWKLFLRGIKNTLKQSTLQRPATELLSYDLVDVTRQSLQIIFAAKYNTLISAYRKNNTQAFRKVSDQLLDVLKDIDTILGADEHYLLGKWLEDAKKKSSNHQESDQYQYNAKNQITLWGPNGEELDYAIKQWAGLTVDYLLPRWKLFVQFLEISMKTGKKFRPKLYAKTVFEDVEKPFGRNQKEYPIYIQGDSYLISKGLWNKYRHQFKLCSQILNRR